MEALSQIVVRDQAEAIGRAIVHKLKEVIPMQQFEIPLREKLECLAIENDRGLHTVEQAGRDEATQLQDMIHRCGKSWKGMRSDSRPKEPAARQEPPRKLSEAEMLLGISRTIAAFETLDDIL